MGMDAIEKGRSRETPFRHKTSLGVHSAWPASHICGVPADDLISRRLALAQRRHSQSELQNGGGDRVIVMVTK
jgi:hypothetical protein